MIVEVIQTVKYRVNAQELAQELDKLTMIYVEQGLLNWRHDLDSRAMYMRDGSDMLKICSAIQDKNWKGAMELMMRMDTAPRECFQEWIENVTEEGGASIMNADEVMLV